MGVCAVLFDMVAVAHCDNRFNRSFNRGYFMDSIGNGNNPVELQYPVGLMKYDLIRRREHLVYAKKSNHPVDFIQQAEKQIKQLEKAINILENYKEPYFDTEND